jgi:hypothetical protein
MRSYVVKGVIYGGDAAMRFSANGVAKGHHRPLVREVKTSR